MTKNIILTIILVLSNSLSYSQNYEVGGGVFLGPFAAENFGLNIHFSHSLDSSKYLQTELSVAGVNYNIRPLKHSFGIYSLEENYIISNDRKSSSVFLYAGFGIGYYLITTPNYNGNWHEKTYTHLSLSNALGFNIKLGVRLSILEIGVKNIFMFSHAKAILNEHFLPDKSEQINKFIAINMFRIYIGLTFKI